MTCKDCGLYAKSARCQGCWNDKAGTGTSSLERIEDRVFDILRDDHLTYAVMKTIKHELIDFHCDYSYDKLMLRHYKGEEDKIKEHSRKSMLYKIGQELEKVALLEDIETPADSYYEQERYTVVCLRNP